MTERIGEKLSKKSQEVWERIKFELALDSPDIEAQELRKQQFIESLDDRQKEYHKSLKGASYTELFLTMEKRIHDLEQALKERDGQRNS